MKVIVNEQQPVKQEIKEGMLVKALRDSGKSVILVIDYPEQGDTFKGIVLHHISIIPNYYGCPLIQNTLVKKYFTPFLGTVTLSND